MNRPETEFSNRLRAALTQIVAERGATQATISSSRSESAGVHKKFGIARVGLGFIAVGALALALMLIISAGDGGSSQAYAVETNPSGMVSVEIRSLDDAKGLEEALDAAGIPSSVTYLTAGMTCKEPRYKQVPWPEDARALTQAKAEPQSSPVEEPNRNESSFRVTGPLIYSISRNAVGPDQTLIITASEGPNGFFGRSDVVIAEGAVAPCEPVPMP